MTPHQLLHPAHWKPARGYANGIAARGRMVLTGGIIGWDAAQQFHSDDFVAQARQALENIVAILREGGAVPEHLVRLTWYVTDKRDYLADLPALGAAYRAVIGPHYPAMALLQVSGLVEDRAKVEIEATAIVPDPAG